LNRKDVAIDTIHTGEPNCLRVFSEFAISRTFVLTRLAYAAGSTYVIPVAGGVGLAGLSDDAARDSIYDNSGLALTNLLERAPQERQLR